MLKIIGKVFYFLFVLLFFYIIYTYSNSVFINTYYNEEIYPHLNDSEKMIEPLVVPFGDKYDSKPVYRAKSFVEGKEFEINFFAFESINKSPGFFITFNNLNFNQTNDLYIKVNFNIGTIPADEYILHFDNKNVTKERHFIRIMLNYDLESDYTYFSYSNNGEALKINYIDNFEFSYSLNGNDYNDFLFLKSNNFSEYNHSEDLFSNDSNEIFTSTNFSGNAIVFNMLNENLKSINEVNTKILSTYHYIIYRNMILSIVFVFFLTFVIFYRKLIAHWLKLLKEKITSKKQ